jgi:hypothetical protein
MIPRNIAAGYQSARPAKSGAASRVATNVL